jgi:hypothetical protein
LGAGVLAGFLEFPLAEVRSRSVAAGNLLRKATNANATQGKFGLGQDLAAHGLYRQPRGI